MYTGTLINDLMMTVERAERSIQHARIVDEMKLERIFDDQVLEMHSEPMFAGAA